MALELENVRYSYPHYVKTGEDPFILETGNLSFPKNCITMVLGRPASGKTTLSRVLEGTAPHLFGGDFSGAVSISGKALNELNPGERLDYLYTARQNAEEQIICNRSDEEAAFTLESLGTGREEIGKRLDNAFAVTGIGALRERVPASLSGGEKKKLSLASLIALDPEVYVLDEALEEIAEESCLEILEYLHKNRKTVVLFVSRLKKEFLPYCSNFILLDGSRSVQNSDIKKIMPRIAADGLDIEQVDNFSENHRTGKEKLLEISGIEFSYPENPEFGLKAGNLIICRNECLSFVGGNGSGKSTLARILCGLLKPARGAVRFAGKELKFGDLCTKTGYVFQNPDFQLFQATVQDELSAAGKKNDPEKIIELFGLPPKGAPAAMLSYGTRKKLQCAVFYALDRELVILDEADSGLSPYDIARIIGLFREKGASVVLITHDRVLAAKTGRRIIFENGRIREEK